MRWKDLSGPQRDREVKAMGRLFKLRWPNGFVCPACGSRTAEYLERRMLWQCRGNYGGKRCRRQTSVTSDTKLHRLRLRPSQWVAAVDALAGEFVGLTASQIRKKLKSGRTSSIKPANLQKGLLIGSLDTAKNVMRVVGGEIATVLSKHGGQSEEASEDTPIVHSAANMILASLLLPRTRQRVEAHKEAKEERTSSDAIQQHDRELIGRQPSRARKAEQTTISLNATGGRRLRSRASGRREEQPGGYLAAIKAAGGREKLNSILSEYFVEGNNRRESRCSRPST
jgi:hypothetical protein